MLMLALMQHVGSHESSLQEPKLSVLHSVMTVCKSIHLQEKISELSAEKEALSEKLKAEEERRMRILTDKNLVKMVTSLIIAA